MTNTWQGFEVLPRFRSLPQQIARQGGVWQHSPLVLQHSHLKNQHTTTLPSTPAANLPTKLHPAGAGSRAPSTPLAVLPSTLPHSHLLTQALGCRSAELLPRPQSALLHKRFLIFTYIALKVGHENSSFPLFLLLCKH